MLVVLTVPCVPLPPEAQKGEPCRWEFLCVELAASAPLCWASAVHRSARLALQSEGFAGRIASQVCRVPSLLVKH